MPGFRVLTGKQIITKVAMQGGRKNIYPSAIAAVNSCKNPLVKALGRKEWGCDKSERTGLSDNISLKPLKVLILLS